MARLDKSNPELFKAKRDYACKRLQDGATNQEIQHELRDKFRSAVADVVLARMRKKVAVEPQKQAINSKAKPRSDEHLQDLLTALHKTMREHSIARVVVNADGAVDIECRETVSFTLK